LLEELVMLQDDDLAKQPRRKRPKMAEMTNNAEPGKGKRLEAKADVKVLLNKSYEQYSLTLETHLQGMELWGSITPKGKGDIIRETDLIRLFKELELTGDINRQNLKNFCAMACLGQPVEDLPIMYGTEPEKGKDEWVEFFALPTSNKPREQTDSRGNVDHHNLRLFENVKEGQLIGQTRPPLDGIPGHSVTGEPILAAKGLPFDIKPRAGANVKTEKSNDGFRFYSEIAGRIIFEMNEISITDKYVVKDDVGVATGHVDFVGDVIVGGNVISGFNVKAGKTLTIKGAVGQKCVIESGGEMTIGGMSGDGYGKILCGGNLNARYLDAVTVEARGNILVKNEIVNSRVKCGGYIDVNLGSIIGGRVTALCGIEAKGIGSEAHVKTQITVGVCYIIEAKKKEIRKLLDPISREIEFISKKLAPAMKNPKAMLSFSQEDRDRIRALAKKFSELTPEQEKLKLKLAELRKEADSKANPMVNGRQVIESGVEITIGELTERISSRIIRPTTVLRHSKKNCLRFASKHALTEKARDIERKIASEEEEAARREAKEGNKNDELI